MRKRLRKQGVKLEWSGAHCLRHACAGQLLDAGFTLKQIADQLGLTAAIGHTRLGKLALFLVLVVTVLTVFVTWPQALFMHSMIAAHDDPLFSMWRLAWVAHALVTDPRHLFDGNIFYPARNTLAFSDAMMVEALLAAPLFWLGVSPVLIYNILLLGGIAASGVAMFVLARHLLGGDGPAVVSAAIFTMAPYRIEHYMHLELQWAMWVPLTLWAIHRAIEERSWRHGMLGGLFLWLQILSSIYYGVFLAACSFEYHGPKGHLGFAPRLTPENFRAPFTTAEGWGTFDQSRLFLIRGEKRKKIFDTKADSFSITSGIATVARIEGKWFRLNQACHTPPRCLFNALGSRRTIW